jgi:ElaB/YqjD/DUF883 family membrane-anchored ribosome-binding protein
MPEPRRTSSDVPEFDTYPAPVNAERELPPIGQTTPSSKALNATAEKIGSAVGSAVGTLRSASSRVKIMPQRGRDSVGDMRERLGDMTEQLKERSQELTQNAREAAEEWKQTARDRIMQARRRARAFTHENPLQALAVAAAIGFAIGVGLRIWRWSLD